MPICSTLLVYDVVSYLYLYQSVNVKRMRKVFSSSISIVLINSLITFSPLLLLLLLVQQRRRAELI